MAVVMKSQIPEQTGRIVGKLYAKLAAEALTLEGDLKRILTGQRTGKLYRSSRTGKLHTASRPGEPPAVDTGHLRGSIHTQQPPPALNIQKVLIPAEYAAYLEYGTRRMAPRPYVHPAVEHSRKRMAKYKGIEVGTE